MSYFRTAFITFIIILSLLTFGCASSKVATSIGTRIGTSYQEAALQGTVNAEESIKAWPYISGLIKGVLAAEYQLNITPLATDVIDTLDSLAAKPALTEEDKGLVIGSFVRLEYLAIQQSWDRYGISILKMVTGI
jgi:hypothetical protein